MKRRIIEIDQDKCNGCGACAEACHEGTIAMVDGKKTGVPMPAEGFGIIYNKDMVDPEAISSMDGLIAFIEEQKAAGVTGLGLSQEGYFLIGQILNLNFAVQDDTVAF